MYQVNATRHPYVLCTTGHMHIYYADCRPIALDVYLINSSGSGWIKLVSRVSFHMPEKSPALSDIHFAGITREGWRASVGGAGTGTSKNEEGLP